MRTDLFGKVNLLNSGYYAWIATGSPVQAGCYSMTFTPPPSTTATGTPGGFGDGDLVLDPNTPGDNPNSDDPLLIGADVDGSGARLADFSAAANPFFLEFDLEQADPLWTSIIYRLRDVLASLPVVIAKNTST